MLTAEGRMYRYRLSAFYLTLVSALLACLLACDDSGVKPNYHGTPELTIRQPEFDFGFTPKGSTITHRFWLYSTGTDTLKIMSIVPG